MFEFKRENDQEVMWRCYPEGEEAEQMLLEYLNWEVDLEKMQGEWSEKDGYFKKAGE